MDYLFLFFVTLIGGICVGLLIYAIIYNDVGEAHKVKQATILLEEALRYQGQPDGWYGNVRRFLKRCNGEG